MANDLMAIFKTFILVQLFFAFSITAITYALPAPAAPAVTAFSEVSDQIDLSGVGQEVQESLESQTNIPLIEVGALVFYSGNILLDLILNFIFAIPEMIGLLVHGIQILFNVDGYLFAIVQLFASVCIFVMMFIALIQMLAGLRAGRTIA